MLTIYGVPPSIHTRKVIVTALEKNLDYRLEIVFPFDPPEDWQSLSPTGRIPVLGDGDFQVADSSVIIAYLERRYSRGALLPDDPEQYARALWFEEYADGNVAPQVIAMFHEKVLGPMHGQQPDPAALENLSAKLAPCLGYLEESLGDGYLAGQSFSIADIAVASNLIMYHYLGYTLNGKPHSKLRAHLKRVLERQSFRTALAAEAPFVEKLGLDGGALERLNQPA